MRRNKTSSNAVMLVSLAAATALVLIVGAIFYAAGQPGGLRLPRALGGSLLPLFKGEVEKLASTYVDVKATNNTGIPISRARLRIRMMAKGRSVPVLELDMTFMPTAGIEPGESAVIGWSLDERETSRITSGIKVSRCDVETLSLYDASGKLIEDSGH